MAAKTTYFECSAHRIAVIIDSPSLVGQRIMIGLCRRATVYPELLVRRYLSEPLAEEGIAPLIDWIPDAIVLYCGNLDLIRQIRKKLPQAIVVATNGLPYDEIDAIVTGSGKELIRMAKEHFSKNGLCHTALFFGANETEGRHYTKAFKEVPGTDLHISEPFVHDIGTENQLSTPQGEWMEKTQKWLKSLPKPIGIFTPTGHSAAYLIRVCTQLKLAIPKDIQVIGCDELDESLECLPHVTSIHLPSERIGIAALETALELLNGIKPASKIQVITGSSLLPQGSTGLLPSSLSDVPTAIAYIESQATQGINVGDVLSQTQNVSRMTFYREFIKETGDSPAHYIRRIQIERARHLLSTTGLQVTRIAELTGFSTSNYFSQVFRRNTGMTPGQYRTSRQQKEK